MPIDSVRAPGLPAAQVSDADRQARRELAACYRLADRMGWSDIISAHISHRVPGEPGHYLINPYGMLFDEITASSLSKTDTQGTILSASEYPLNPAVLVIHAAILGADKKLMLLRDHGTISCGDRMPGTYGHMHRTPCSASRPARCTRDRPDCPAAD